MGGRLRWTTESIQLEISCFVGNENPLSNMTTKLGNLTSLWDVHINGWLAGDDGWSGESGEVLSHWFRSYAGKGEGTPTLAGMPEPWIGDLTNPNSARLVILGLNPGMYLPALQSRPAGRYAQEVREVGSFTRWAAKNPYLCEPWIGKKGGEGMGANRYHKNRLEFARNWLGDRSLPDSALVLMELYPWHSTRVTASMDPGPEILRRFILEPIDELVNVHDIFAFGKPWSNILRGSLESVDRFGGDGGSYGSSVASRTVQVFLSPGGKRIIVMWQSGYAGPPSARNGESAHLKLALDRINPRPG